MKTILDAQQDALERPDEIFAHFLQAERTTSIRRGQLWQEAARFANLLKNEGVPRGEVVVIILPHSPDLLFAFLGAMLAGTIPSFMPPPSAKQDPDLYWASHKKLFARLRPGAMITDAGHEVAFRKNLPSLSFLLLDRKMADAQPSVFFGETPRPDQIALLQHSSGTTGLKKGVALTHQAVLRQIESYRGALGIRSDDCIVSWLPLYHDMGLVACFLLPLITGTPVVMLDPFEWVVKPRLLFDAIKRFRGTLCWQPNFAFQHLCRTVRPTAEFDLSSMRIWNDCSEPCRSETLRMFAQTFSVIGVESSQLQVCYAMAETVFAVTQTQPGREVTSLRVLVEPLRDEQRVCLAQPDETGQTLLSVGRVIDGLRIRIVDETGAQLPENQIGTVAIAGHCLFEGYFKQPEETAQKLHNGWYRSGDQGFLHGDELYVTGRLDDLLIVHGRNYYAHELEYLVNQVDGVHPGRNVALGWFKTEIGSEEVVIIAESAAMTSVDQEKVTLGIKHALLNETGLLVYDVRLVNTGWLVKTTSGKISRRENLAKYLSDQTCASAA